MNDRKLVATLAKYAMTKKGAQQSASHANANPLEFPALELPGVLWGSFFEEGNGPFFRLPIKAKRLEELRQQQPALRESTWMERDGHVYVEVPFDADVPLPFLKQLIDEAHALIWGQLSNQEKLKIELREQPYDEKALVTSLVNLHGLQEHRKAIFKLAKPAVLLRTRKGAEAKIPLGATKIGGRPDLPAKTPWPTYRDGRPLAFLAQYNLKDLRPYPHALRGLPTSGVLSFFSAWGWYEEGAGDPQVPADAGEQTGWTVLLHTPARSKLERRKTPKGLHTYKGAAVDLIPILTFPNHAAEPTVQALRWPDELWRRVDRLQSEFRAMQMGHHLNNYDGFASAHTLGGYAVFQQCYPQEELAANDRMMFAQIGSDDRTNMMWSDGGELTFYVDAKALRAGRLERVWGDCQGG